MSLGNLRCKAFCKHVEQALWVILALAIFTLWCFYLFKAVTS